MNLADGVGLPWASWGKGEVGKGLSRAKPAPPFPVTERVLMLPRPLASSQAVFGARCFSPGLWVLS